MNTRNKIVAVGAGIVLGLATTAIIVKQATASSGKSTVQGAWYVDTVGAPFTPHLFAFHSDGILHVTFPDAAEANNSAGMGIGVWERVSKNKYRGKFIENNADKTTNKFTTNLIVTFTIEVSGNTLIGPASASYFDGDGVLTQGPFPATLNGQRITFDSNPPIVAD